MFISKLILGITEYTLEMGSMYKNILTIDLTGNFSVY